MMVFFYAAACFAGIGIYIMFSGGPVGGEVAGAFGIALTCAIAGFIKY